MSLNCQKRKCFFGVIHPILGVFSSFFHFRWKKHVSSGAVFSVVFSGFFSTMRKKPANPVRPSVKSTPSHMKEISFT